MNLHRAWSQGLGTFLLASIAAFIPIAAAADSSLDRLFDLSGLLVEDHSLRLALNDGDRRRDRYSAYHGDNKRHRRSDFQGSRFSPPNARSRDYGFHSYTSPPLRGGSSRRTRIIENPYSHRLVTGITLTGIDDGIVHLKDVVAYPGRYHVSPLAYTLSAFHPSRFISTGGFIDYISVAAKRKEYFTVTFHYD